VRVFWTIILVLVGAAAYLVWQRVSSSADRGGRAGDSAMATPAPATSAMADRTSKPRAVVDDVPSDLTPSVQADLSVAPAPATFPGLDAAPAPQVAAVPATPAIAETSATTETKPAPAAPDAAAISRELDEILGSSDGEVSRPVVPLPAEPADVSAAGGAKAGPSRGIVQRDDGTMLIDDRFIVRGKGTEADPYRLPWELLVSAQETYAPRKGLKTIPARLSMFDNTHVRISGFIAFPITSTSPREMLVMLSQWDGCCIGVPPTAYDAIEVRLGATPTPAQRSSNQGTLRGVLKIDPLEDAGWLLGLYVIEDGKLTTEE